MLRKFFVAIPITVLCIGGSTACATKKFVRTEVGGVNDKVTTLSGQLEANEQRTKENEQKIAQVDEKAGQADTKAVAAGRSADEAKQAAQQVAAKADAIDKASRKLVYEVVLSEAQGGFKFGRAVLPDEAKAQLDKLVTDISADPKNVFFEIEGHTDSAGSAKFNESLGQERAESVKLYLYETHKVPLHKINVISYGESKPVSPNKTRTGRAENRRIVVRVLS
jgi:outer membrane protein OmpA-like peptidoglycan-associated protein